MSAPYTGVPANATDTIELFDGLDRPTAQSVIVPLQRLLDGVVDARSRADTAEPRADAGAKSALLKLRLVDASVVTTDTAFSIAAAQALDPTAANPISKLVVLKTGESYGLSDSADIETLGAPTSITSLVTDACFGKPDRSRLIVIGTGGNNCSFSDDNGATWTTGGAIVGTPNRIVWNEVHNRFMVAEGSDLSHSTNGVAWTNVVVGNISQSVGFAVLANGTTVSAVAATGIMRRSTDGGATWANASGTVDGQATLDDGGTVAGDGGALVYHCGRHSSGADMRVCSSPDGNTWTLRATIEPPSAALFSVRPRIMRCQATGVMYIVVTCNALGADLAYASVDNGLTWIGPGRYIPDLGTTAYAVAGGRLISTGISGTDIQASDGA